MELRGDNRKFVASLLYHLVAVTVLLCVFVTVADSLQCFQCGTTADKHDCIDDWSGLVNTSRGITDYYAKNCTAANVNWTRCMIHTSESRGIQSLFHRGCHDGVTFSKLYAHTRLTNLPANNATTCATIVESREFVCFTFCDTDFCNGPQPPPETKVCETADGNGTYVIKIGETCGAAGMEGAATLVLMLVMAVFVTMFFSG